MKKILILAANPKDTLPLRLNQELRDIEEGLQRAQKRDQFTLVQKLAVRPRDIQRAMLDNQPHIVHFSGHGTQDEGLVFENEIGESKLVSKAALARFFKVFASKIECVVLNGCYSVMQAEAIAEHINYVIGMSQAIGDQAAIEFAVGFYDALGAGSTIEVAYDVGCSAIGLAGIEEHLTPVLLKKDHISLPQKTKKQFNILLRSLPTTLLTSIGITTLVVLTRLSGVLEPVELLFFDQMMRFPRREEPDERLLLIQITPDDIQKYGRGQGTSLPDKTIGELLKMLVDLKPGVIGLDLYREFPTQDENLKQLFKKEDNNIFAVCKVAAPESNSLGTTPPPGYEIPFNRIGFSDFSEDRDHVVRRQLLRMDTKDIDKSPCGKRQTMDSFSFKLAQKYLSKNKKEYKSTKNSIDLASGNIVLQRLFGSTTGGYQSIERLLGAYQVLLNYRPACRRGNTSVPECSPHKIAQQEITVTDALKGKLLNKNSVEDKIVLIGTKIDGIDFLLPTPFSFGEQEPRMPGLIMQAQMVSQLISAVEDKRPLLRVWSIEYEIGWILLWSVVGGIVVQFCPSNKILILSEIVAVTSLYVVCLIFFTQFQLWIPWIPPAFSLLRTSGFVVVLIRLKAQKLS